MAQGIYKVIPGPSVFMCGHCTYHVCVEGKPGIRATFVAQGHEEAKKIEHLLNSIAIDASALRDQIATVRQIIEGQTEPDGLGALCDRLEAAIAQDSDIDRD